MLFTFIHQRQWGPWRQNFIIIKKGILLSQVSTPVGFPRVGVRVPAQTALTPYWFIRKLSTVMVLSYAEDAQTGFHQNSKSSLNPSFQKSLIYLLFRISLHTCLHLGWNSLGYISTRKLRTNHPSCGYNQSGPWRILILTGMPGLSIYMCKSPHDNGPISPDCFSNTQKMPFWPVDVDSWKQADFMPRPCTWPDRGQKCKF